MHAQALLDSVVSAYMVCALWSSTDDDGEPLDGFYEVYDLADEAQASMIEDVQGFLDIVEDEDIDWRSGWSADQLGHDFWLTRNGHGAGFWDRYSGDGQQLTEIGDQLTKWAKSFGTSDVYVGDDGKLYVT